ASETESRKSDTERGRRSSQGRKECRGKGKKGQGRTRPHAQAPRTTRGQRPGDLRANAALDGVCRGPPEKWRPGPRIWVAGGEKTAAGVDRLSRGGPGGRGGRDLSKV